MTTAKGRHLTGRKKEDTVPELLLRKALHAAGGRFRLHRQLAKGCTPDLVLPRRRLAIFVDGCFWHGCPAHGRRTAWTGPNAKLWQEKMFRNRQRDERSTELAATAGWNVLRVWECEVMQDAGAVAARALTCSEQSTLPVRQGVGSDSNPVGQNESVKNVDSTVETPYGG